MPIYQVECMETTTFIVEVEAQNEDEARDLVNADVNTNASIAQSKLNLNAENTRANST